MGCGNRVVRMLDSQSRHLGVSLWGGVTSWVTCTCSCLKAWTVLFTLTRFTQLPTENLNHDGYMRMNSHCAVIAAWLNASPRNSGGKV